MSSRDLSKFEPNLIERAISKFAPKAAQRLHKSRMQFELQASFGRSVGGYIGARRDRAATAEFNPTGGSPASDIYPDLPTLRARSRDQMRNAPIALGALNTESLHVVGTGLSYTPAIDARVLGITEERAQQWTRETKAKFKAWAESPDCDVQRQLDFYSLTELAYRSWMESGDAFVLTPIIERDGEQQLALQLIEADRVSQPRGQRTTATFVDGMELDETTGEVKQIHVARFHPGDPLRLAANEWTPIRVRGEKTGRRNVLHLFDVVRPGQVRGVPWVAPIIEPLKQLGKWTDAELNAAVISSLIALFVKMDPDAFSEMFDEQSQTNIINDAQKWSGAIESGKAVNLLPGEEIQAHMPNRPNPEFDPFWTAMVRQMGMALGVPYEVLVMHFQSSYTAARAAFVMAWRRWYTRRDKTAKMLCQPVLELWLSHEVASGRIACPGFFASKAMRAAWCAAVWTGDGPGSVDPVKDVTAAKMRVELGITTLQQESVLHDGIDWETKQAQRAKEVQRQRLDGTLPAAATPAAAPAEPPANDNGSDDDTEVPQQRRLPSAPRR
jgi:lambda family phage portal protein